MMYLMYHSPPIHMHGLSILSHIWYAFFFFQHFKFDIYTFAFVLNDWGELPNSLHQIFRTAGPIDRGNLHLLFPCEECAQPCYCVSVSII